MAAQELYEEFKTESASTSSSTARQTGNAVNYEDIVSKIRYRDHAGNDSTRNEVVMFVDVRLFIMGVEVSNWLIGDISVTRAKGSTDGTMSFTLDNNYERFIVRAENLGGETPSYNFNQDPTKGLNSIKLPDQTTNRWIENSGNQRRGTFEYDEEAKKALYEYKAAQKLSVTGIKRSSDATGTDQMLPKFDLTIGACVIHLHDEVRAFVADPNHDPLNDNDRRWMPLFSGVVSTAPVSRNRMTGESTITISCADVRYLMRKMRVATNIQSADQKKLLVKFDNPIGIFRDCVVLSSKEGGKVKFENQLSALSYRQLTRALLCGETIEDIQKGDSIDKASGHNIEWMSLPLVDPYSTKLNTKSSSATSDTAVVSSGLGSFSLGLEKNFIPAKSVTQITEAATNAAAQHVEHAQALVVAIKKLQTDATSISGYLSNTSYEPLSNAISSALYYANQISSDVSTNTDNATLTVTSDAVTNLQSITAKIKSLWPPVKTQFETAIANAKKIIAVQNKTDTSITSTDAGQLKQQADANKAADILPTDIDSVATLASTVQSEAKASLDKKSIASDAMTQRQGNIATLEDWNDMMTFGAKRNWYTDSEVDIIGSGTKPIIFLSGQTVDADKLYQSNPSPYSIMNGFVHYLMPDTVSTALGMRNALERALVTPGSDVNWTNRLDGIAQASESLDYQFYVTPMGDIAFEFTMYDFDPSIFGKYAPCYTVRDSIKTDEHNDEGDGAVVTGLIVRGAYQATDKGSNTSVTDTTNDFAYSYIVKSDYMAEKYGPVVEEYSIPWHHKVWADGKEDDAREKNSLITFGIIEFYRRISAMSSMGFSGCYNPFLLPNRPVLNVLQRRMALVTSCQISIPIGGAPSSSVDTYFVRHADHNGKFISITGQSNTPFSYGNADYLDLFTTTDLSNIRTPYGIEIIDPSSSMVQAYSAQFDYKQFNSNASLDGTLYGPVWDKKIAAWNAFSKSTSAHDKALLSLLTQAAADVGKGLKVQDLWLVLNQESGFKANAFNGANKGGNYGILQLSAKNVVAIAHCTPAEFYSKYPTVESQMPLVVAYLSSVQTDSLSTTIRVATAVFEPSDLTSKDGINTVHANMAATNGGVTTTADYITKTFGSIAGTSNGASSTTVASTLSTITTGLNVVLTNTSAASDNTVIRTTSSHK